MKCNQIYVGQEATTAAQQGNDEQCLGLCVGDVGVDGDGNGDDDHHQHLGLDGIGDDDDDQHLGLYNLRGEVLRCATQGPSAVADLLCKTKVSDLKKTNKVSDLKQLFFSELGHTGLNIIWSKGELNLLCKTFLVHVLCFWRAVLMIP